MRAETKCDTMGKTILRRYKMDNHEELSTNQAGRNTWQKVKMVSGKAGEVLGVIVNLLYKLRKVFMAAPVVYYAIKLARYNSVNLPKVVGINLQANGAFAQTITRQLAVMGPLGVTAACLLLMFLSRKAMYPWAISIFSLALPLLLLLTNRYPA